MQTIIGRVVANAVVKEIKDGRKLVAFTVAQNDRFKVKGSDQVKQLTNYFNCSYWLSTGVAGYLRKGVIVETSGRLGVNAWINAYGEARASLMLHVESIRIHGGSKKGENIPEEPATAITAGDAKDDMPF